MCLAAAIEFELSKFNILDLVKKAMEYLKDVKSNCNTFEIEKTESHVINIVDLTNTVYDEYDPNDPFIVVAIIEIGAIIKIASKNYYNEKILKKYLVDLIGNDNIKFIPCELYYYDIVSYNDRIQIGSENHSIKYWKENYRELGYADGLHDEDIEEYGKITDSL